MKLETRNWKLGEVEHWAPQMHKSYRMVTIVEAKPMNIPGMGEESFLNLMQKGLFRSVWESSDALIEVVFKFQVSSFKHG